VRRQSAAATALWLNASRKEINRPLLKSQSGVVASLCPRTPHARVVADSSQRRFHFSNANCSSRAPLTAS